MSSMSENLMMLNSLGWFGIVWHGLGILPKLGNTITVARYRWMNNPPFGHHTMAFLRRAWWASCHCHSVVTCIGVEKDRRRTDIKPELKAISIVQSNSQNPEFKDPSNPKIDSSGGIKTAWQQDRSGKRLPATRGRMDWGTIYLGLQVTKPYS